MSSKIFETLCRLGMTSKDTREIFSQRTRDKEDLKVWKDIKSEVIYIDSFYVGEKEYSDSTYLARTPDTPDMASARDQSDLKRREKEYSQYIAGKSVCDFGCGKGIFLRNITNISKDTLGVEIQTSHLNSMKESNIECTSDLSLISNNSFDTICCFHVLEHLPDPIKILRLMKSKLKENGTLLVEVPHAKALLLRKEYECKKFKEFSLWSQHLILHTRESLSAMLRDSGFQSVIIEGVQRYPLSNHFHWMLEGRPGGHFEPISQIDTPLLNEQYSLSLGKIDATDTLVAIAR